MAIQVPAEALVRAYAADALARCEELRRQADWLQQQQYRSGTPVKLAEMLCSLARIAAKNLQNTVQDHLVSRSESSFQRIRAWDSVIRTAASHVRYLWGSQADRNPGTLSRTLDNVLGERGIGAEVLLREKWKYNYAVNLHQVSDWYRSPLKGVYSDAELDELLPRTKSPIYTIAHPAIERHSILLHAALGHELGHLVVEEWLQKNNGKVSLGIALRDKAIDIVDKRSDDASPSTELERASEITATVSEIGWRRRRLLEEYGADLVGAQFFGPASLFALAHIGIPLPQAPYNSRAKHLYYPPLAGRMELVLNSLREETADGESWLPLPNDDSVRGLREAVDERVAAIESLVQGQRGSSDPIDSAAIELAQKGLQEFKVYMRERFGEELSPSTTMVSACRLVLSLQKHLPPNDLSNDPSSIKAPPLEAVLNAAWFYRIWSIDANVDLSKRVDELAVLNRLVIKALEDITLIRDYDSWVRKADDNTRQRCALGETEVG